MPNHFSLLLTVVLVVSLALSAFIFVVPGLLPQQSPSNLLQKPGIEEGAPTFTIVNGPNISISGAAGNNVSNSFEIDASQSSLPIRVFYDDGTLQNNGTRTIPNGTEIFLTIDGSSFRLGQMSGAGPFSTNDPLLALPNGLSSVSLTVEIPTTAYSGTYSFWVFIDSYSDKTANFITYTGELRAQVVISATISSPSNLRHTLSKTNSTGSIISLIGKPLTEQKDPGTTLNMTVVSNGPYVTWVSITTPQGSSLNMTRTNLPDNTSIFSVSLGPNFPSGNYTVLIHGVGAPGENLVSFSGIETGYPDPSPPPI